MILNFLQKSEVITCSIIQLNHEVIYIEKIFFEYKGIGRFTVAFFCASSRNCSS